MTPTMTPAESSPATIETPGTFEVPQGAARSEWIKTGNIPTDLPKADPAPARTKNTAEGDKPEETAPASEPGNKQERRSNADTRLNELLDDLRAAGLTPKALKTFTSEWDRKQASSAPARAPETTENRAPAGLTPPVKPKSEDFEGKTWAEYEAAKDQYHEDLAEYKARKSLADYQEGLKQEATAKELKESLAAASERYGETAQETIGTTSQEIYNDPKVSGVVKALLNESPVMVDVLYALGSKPEDLADFLKDARDNPSAAIRKLVLVEKFVQEELAGNGGKPEATERATDGKFRSAAPVEKKPTNAPPPAREVSGRNPAPPDDVESAMANVLNGGDSRAAIDAMTRKKLREMRG